MGLDKSHLEIDGMPLWRKQVETLAQAGADEILISGDPTRTWDGWTGKILEDDQPESGPLSGLIMALRRARFPLVLILAVDMPGMTAVGLQDLIKGTIPPQGVVPGRGVIPSRGDRHYEPLAAVYPREALRLAETCRDEGCLAVQKFAVRAVAQGCVLEKKIPLSDEGLFANINTPQAWETFLQKKNSCRDPGHSL